MIGNLTEQALRDKIVAALRTESTIPEELAVDAAALILRVLHEHQCGRGGALYIPAPPKKYPIAELKQAYAEGKPVRSICRELKISVYTFYRLLTLDSK